LIKQCREHDDYVKNFIVLKKECTSNAIKAVVNKMAERGLMKK